jgi:two-component system sensor histidine kinase HydH
LVNAMQAMPDGGAITVELADRQDTLTIVFSDEGKGIPDDILQKIWQPFFTTKDKGSGLGLPVVRKIVEGHGGTVRIENGALKGVQVTVTLPVGKGDRVTIPA